MLEKQIRLKIRRVGKLYGVILIHMPDKMRFMNSIPLEVWTDNQLEMLCQEKIYPLGMVFLQHENELSEHCKADMPTRQLRH